MNKQIQSAIDKDLKWDNEELGADEKYVSRVSDELRSEINEAVGLKPISIRLQESLIDKLKLIAKYRGIGYQPLVRDLLNRFARAELRKIAGEMKAELEEEDSPAASYLDDEVELKRA